MSSVVIDETVGVDSRDAILRSYDPPSANRQHEPALKRLPSWALYAILILLGIAFVGLFVAQLAAGAIVDWLGAQGIGSIPIIVGSVVGTALFVWLGSRLDR